MSNKLNSLVESCKASFKGFFESPAGTEDTTTRLRQEINRIAKRTGQTSGEVFKELNELAKDKEPEMLKYAKLDR